MALLELNFTGVKRSRSDVADLVEYELEDYPSWRNEKEKNKTVNEMLKDIQKFQSHWGKVKTDIDSKLARNVLREMELSYYFHTNKEEGHGLGTIGETEEIIKSEYQKHKRKLSKSEQEVINILRAYKYLEGVQKSDQENMALLDSEILRAAHKIILEDIEMGAKTRPGEFSQLYRVTEFRGEMYVYNKGNQDTEGAVQRILDRYNSLISSCKRDWDEARQESIARIFKTAAYLLFEMLDVHPFSDGNGRLCRLLVSYSLSFITPFPSTVYNLWSEITDKDAYIQALVDTRKSANRQPHRLAAMIIECNWYAWKEFFSKLKINMPEINC